MDATPRAEEGGPSLEHRGPLLEASPALTKSSATSVGIKAGFILIMTNQHNGDNPPNNAASEREAPSRAEFQEFQETMQQIIQRLQHTLEQMQIMGPIQNHKDDDAHDDDGIRVRPVHHPRHALINHPPTYDNFSDDEDYVDGVFGRNVGAEQRGGGRGGVGDYKHDVASGMGNAYGGAGYNGAYREQLICQDYDREES